MSFLYLKAVHIVFVVTWFAGMFYLVRLFIYNREAQDKKEPDRQILQEQFGLMIGRLYWAITFPSALITLGMGLSLLHSYGPLPSWLHIKLAFVALLYLYQYSLHRIYKQQKKGIFKHSSQQLRLWNEVPTVLLVAIVMLVVVRSNLSWVYGILGLFALVITLMVSIRIYKALRKS